MKLFSEKTAGTELGVHRVKKKILETNNRLLVNDDSHLMFLYDSVLTKSYFRNRNLPETAIRLRNHNDPKPTPIDPFVDLENWSPVWET